MRFLLFMNNVIQCFDVGHGGEVCVTVVCVGLGLGDEHGAFAGTEPGEVEGRVAADDAGEDVGAHIATPTAGAVGDVAVSKTALLLEVMFRLA